jgi:thioredoxin 1
MKKEKIQNVEHITATSNHVVVKVGASWCGPCKLLTPKLEELEKQFPQIQFIDVPIDAIEDGVYSSEKFSVRKIPNTMFFLNGTRVHQVIGDATKDEIQRAIEKWML